MSPSGDEELRWQCSSVALGSPRGITSEVLLNLAAPWAVQMKYNRSPVGNGSSCSCSAEVRLLTMKCCCSGRPVGGTIWSPSGARRHVGGAKSSPSGVWRALRRPKWSPVRTAMWSPSCTWRSVGRAKWSPKGSQKAPSWAQEAAKAPKLGPRGAQ